MFEWIGGETLEVLWEGPGVSEQPIPASRLFSWTTRQPACGIGLELALLLPGLIWLHQRRLSEAASARCKDPS